MFNQFDPQNNQPGFGSFNNQFPKAYEIVKVNGEQGATMLPMSPRSEVIAIDISKNDQLVAWYMKTDDAGYKTKTAYSLTPIMTQEEQTIKTLEERIKVLEDKLNEKSTSGQSAE